MALCINQAGTYRNITTLCINQAGTYRSIITGCINQAGTYRRFGGPGAQPTSRGSSFGGGFAICLCPTANNLTGQGVVMIVSPRSAEVSRTWDNRNDANTLAQSCSGCTGWFVPTRPQIQTGYLCRSFWGPSPCSSFCNHWSSTEGDATGAFQINFNFGSAFPISKTYIFCVRAFRCVTY